MHSAFVSYGTSRSIPIWLVTPANWPSVRDNIEASARGFADASGFEPQPGRHLLLPSVDGALSGVLFGIEPASKGAKDPFITGKLPGLLPAGTYWLANPLEVSATRLFTLAFALGAYRFSRYRDVKSPEVKLEIPEGLDAAELTRIAEGVTLARDLVNTPANDLGPAELEDAARALASRHGAMIGSIVGDELLAANFPLIHAVGRAAARPPRLIDLT
ncbi:MAG TPA: leucyl aminopeptidase family protein, partial [Xanthobacteraceae bacterium]|nr:leucyl aminopeptidase family protein [Xanthobacteraceae bacterium]